MQHQVRWDKRLEHALLDDMALDAPWQLVERFSKLVRISGSEDERAAARYIGERLSEWGVPHETYEPELFLSIPVQASVVLDGRQLRAKTPAFSLSTRDEGLRGELVYVPSPPLTSVSGAYAAPPGAADVAGKIVLTEGLGLTSQTMVFEKLGALGQVYISPGKNIHWGMCSSIWGAPDLDSWQSKPHTVIATVNRDDGEVLKACAKGGSSHVTLHARLEEGWKKCPLVVADIPGAVEPDKFVLVHGHIDSWDIGIGDNATGDAVLLEITRVFWKRKHQLKRSLRVAWWPGHSTGRYAGSTWYCDRFAMDLHDNCIAQVCVDSPGCRWATEFRDVSWMSEAETLCRQVIHAVTGKEASGKRPPYGGDYSFNNLGITGFFLAFSFISPEKSKELGYYRVGGCGGNIGWHTEDDTLEIADPDMLLRDARVFAAALGRVLNARLYPFDFRLTADEFVRTLTEYQAAADSHFDFSPAVHAAHELRRALDKFYRRLAHAKLTSSDVRRANALLLSLSRVLVPINFSRRDRFFHDTAASIPPLPDLAPAKTLATLPPGSLQYRLTITHLIRGQNRVVEALSRATRTASTFQITKG